MEKEKTYYTRDLIEEAIDELEEQIQWYEKEEERYDQDDLISEIADNNTPIYTYDLLQYASNNFDLLEQNDLMNDQPDVISILQANIYEVLTEALYEHINKTK